MKVKSPNGFYLNRLSVAGQKHQVQSSKPVKVNTVQAKKTIVQQMDTQKQRHLSFLARARESMAFYQEKIEDANRTINKYQNLEYEEFQEMVKQAREAIPEFEAMQEDLNQSIDNGIEENAFIMNTLESLLNEGGKFPVHTLEEYMKKKAEEEQQSDTNERPRCKSYSLDDLDNRISSLKKELRGRDFSAKA